MVVLDGPAAEDSSKVWLVLFAPGECSRSVGCRGGGAVAGVRIMVSGERRALLGDEREDVRVVARPECSRTWPKVGAGASGQRVLRVSHVVPV